MYFVQYVTQKFSLEGGIEKDFGGVHFLKKNLVYALSTIFIPMQLLNIKTQKLWNYLKWWLKNQEKI